MSNLLAAIKPTLLATLLDLGAVDTIYCAPRDIARNGQQHIESLAIIFSGSHAVILVTTHLHQSLSFVALKKHETITSQ